MARKMACDKANTYMLVTDLEGRYTDAHYLLSLFFVLDIFVIRGREETLQKS